MPAETMRARIVLTAWATCRREGAQDEDDVIPHLFKCISGLSVILNGWLTGQLTDDAIDGVLQQIALKAAAREEGVDD